jgi:ABC-type nitrate/sulfonate/bicarbonate transport system substrate-binding protein
MHIARNSSLRGDMTPIKYTSFLILATSALLASCASTPVQHPVNDPVTLRVNVFRSATNIPIYMAEEMGAFAKRNVRVELQFTPNSSEQRAGLAEGRSDLAHTAADNAVAMVEVAKVDAVIVSGGDSGLLELFVRPEIKTLSDVRGKAMVVDAPNTAYALVARKILKTAGLVDGRDYRLVPIGGTESRVNAFSQSSDNAVGMLNPPWTFVAESRGARSFGKAKELFGPYQGISTIVMRSWAQANRGALERYLAAYIEGCRLTTDPANREQVIAVLRKRLNLTADVARRSYEGLIEPGYGLSRDCRLDMAGFRNALALRAEIEGQWGGVPPEPGKYLELGYFERALSAAGQ